MNIVTIIQARMGSTRLPGKTMLPLDGKHVLERDIKRVSRADSISETIVATSGSTADDIIERYAGRAGATVFRGSESDVLGRMHKAATAASADVVVRITGDCPLISPRGIDAVVKRLRKTNNDYVTNTLEQTLPRGLDVEAFTYETFTEVENRATVNDEREHVTLHYRRNQNRFDLANVTDRETFDTEILHGRDDLRLTLDEADDYELLRRVYEGLEPDGHLDIEDAIAYIDQEDLGCLNQDIQQKHTED
ncbi:glycosyltransferase family protein [Halosimplex rubrum]|uniref:Glycosyltransferase family protein n=1 Tax=Halosimplex rubrum TaxID=869889 RepID=A0A7D5SZ48_9EURY|nr:glycosyltransferase family protein [Halosimplex rubrum]QLH76828.1 glycosyltransferase family protein [Halosimplex rubrum]